MLELCKPWPLSKLHSLHLAIGDAMAAIYKKFSFKVFKAIGHMAHYSDYGG